MEFKDVVMSRYATKKFTGKIIPDEKINQLLDLIRYAPSSANIQPWKVKIIKDKGTKEKLLQVSYNQPQITTCSHLLVFCANKDIIGNLEKLEEEMRSAGTPEDKLKAFDSMIRPFIENIKSDEAKLSWAQRQLYIALGNAVNGAKSLGFDSCPMEGFQPDEYSKILELPDNLVPTALVPVGYAADKPGKKLRFPKEEVFF